MKKILWMIIVLFSFTLNGCLFLDRESKRTEKTIWTKEKLEKKVYKSFDEVDKATKSALEELTYPIHEITTEDTETKIKTTCSNGKNAWINIIKLKENITKIEIQAGIAGDRKASKIIMDKIMAQLEMPKVK